MAEAVKPSIPSKLNASPAVWSVVHVLSPSFSLAIERPKSISSKLKPTPSIPTKALIPLIPMVNNSVCTVVLSVSVAKYSDFWIPKLPVPSKKSAILTLNVPDIFEISPAVPFISKRTSMALPSVSSPSVNVKFLFSKSTTVPSL